MVHLVTDGQKYSAIKRYFDLFLKVMTIFFPVHVFGLWKLLPFSSTLLILSYSRVIFRYIDGFHIEPRAKSVCNQTSKEQHVSTDFAVSSFQSC